MLFGRTIEKAVGKFEIVERICTERFSARARHGAASMSTNSLHFVQRAGHGHQPTQIVHQAQLLCRRQESYRDNSNPRSGHCQRPALPRQSRAPWHDVDLRLVVDDELVAVESRMQPLVLRYEMEDSALRADGRWVALRVASAAAFKVGQLEWFRQDDQPRKIEASRQLDSAVSSTRLLMPLISTMPALQCNSLSSRMASMPSISGIIRSSTISADVGREQMLQQS